MFRPVQHFAFPFSFPFFGQVIATIATDLGYIAIPGELENQPYRDYNDRNLSLSVPLRWREIFASICIYYTIYLFSEVAASLSLCL